MSIVKQLAIAAAIGVTAAVLALVALVHLVLPAVGY